MTLTTKTLASYLGKPVSVLLSDPPFNDWAYEKSIDTDLEEPIIDYVFPQNGLDLLCDEDFKVSTIFLYSDEDRRFNEDILDIPFSLTRQQVIEKLGSPIKSGEGVNDPILGKYGAWDRFQKSEYSIHVEYRVDSDLIKKITLMRADVVP